MYVWKLSKCIVLYCIVLFVCIEVLRGYSIVLCQYACIYVCMYACICMYVCVCVCMYVCMYVCMFVCICVYVCSISLFCMYK